MLIFGSGWITVAIPSSCQAVAQKSEEPDGNFVAS